MSAALDADRARAGDRGAEVVVVLTNLPDAQCAERIARALVSERLAACVNLLAPCRSVYRWNGEVEIADEVPALIKTVAARVPALIARLEQLHPYELPEAVMVRADGGLQRYLDWVADSTLDR